MSSLKCGGECARQRTLPDAAPCGRAACAGVPEQPRRRIYARCHCMRRMGGGADEGEGKAGHPCRRSALLTCSCLSDEAHRVCDAASRGRRLVDEPLHDPIGASALRATAETVQVGGAGAGVAAARIRRPPPACGASLRGSGGIGEPPAGLGASALRATAAKGPGWRGGRKVCIRKRAAAPACGASLMGLEAETSLRRTHRRLRAPRSAPMGGRYAPWAPPAQRPAGHRP